VLCLFQKGPPELILRWSPEPEQGEDFTQNADNYQKLIMPGTNVSFVFRASDIYQSLDFRTGLTHWQHPSFFAYFPTAWSFEATLGDLYATSIPNPGFNVCLAFTRK
jgi:aromatic-L-amino-acid/L-tryptophan decarboxylase